MRRFELVPTATGTGILVGVTVPNVAGSYVCLGYVGNRVLIMRPETDGAAPTPTTLADYYATRTVTIAATPDTVDMDGNVVKGQPERVETLPNLDVNDDPLTPAQVSALKTRLTAAGVPLGNFDSDGVVDRRKLLRFLLRRWLGWRLSDITDGLHVKGYDVA